MAFLLDWFDFYAPTGPRDRMASLYTGNGMLTRRWFLGGLSGGLAASVLNVAPEHFDVKSFDRTRVLRDANRYLTEKPRTVTASISARSAGGKHDFFSEGDYWWPDPKNPDGPYIRRDGMSNPGNFDDHRKYLLAFSVRMPALASTWVLTKDRRYSDQAIEHLNAWFVDPQTRMNPNLQYAQAIHGRTTGRGTGIIDTIHLVEVARATQVLHAHGVLSANEFAPIKAWFADYVNWMENSANGKAERDAQNNHGTCWAMQIASFATLTSDGERQEAIRTRYRTALLPNQMAEDGSFPRELARTKPYSYSLFNLEAMSAICQILSRDTKDLWNFELADGRGMRRGLEFMAPYIRDKASWPKPADVMYFKDWPMRESSLLFGSIAFDKPSYLDIWKTLPAESNVEEIIRNFFIRQPVLWVVVMESQKS
ncbi:MAG TPA: alginate lyase family protein [Bryobacteraceae bacterium]|nr:alginate lyase family protein [Bryobacteraceae bacterium]